MKKLELSCISGGNIKWYIHFENSLAVPQQLNTVLLYDPAIPLLIIPQRNDNICSHKETYMNVYSSIIHNSQKVETVQMSIS